VKPELLQALFQGFTDESFRLETLQHYQVPGDEERQQAFREGRPLPMRPAKQATLDLFREATSRGKLVHRVHVVDQPLSDYVRYELAAYAENQAAGERVWIADRAAHPDLEQLREDFNLFDGDTDHPVVVFYRYTDDGHLLGYERSMADSVVDRCRRQRDLALAHAVTLDEFLADAHS